MSQQKYLFIFKDGEETRVALDKERIVIGRDASCDVPLQHGSISRKHAAILNKFGSVYVENISSTGKIFKSGEPIEHVEILEGEEVVMGPFSLQWKYDDANARPAAAPEASAEGDEPVIAPIPSDQATRASQEEAPAEENGNEARELQVAGDEARSDNEADPAHESPQFEVVAASDRTQISPASVKPMLKIAKGEIIGREIRLENGFSWIVGRSAKSHIQIDNHKISRQHFKIIKIGNAYRVEDLGSANGTRVNGVAVTDSPLQSFDTIQAGPVEVQFLMANANHQPKSADTQIAGPPLEMAAMSDEAAPNAQDKTSFAPPAIYDPSQASESTRVGVAAAALGAAANAAAARSSGASDPRQAGPQSKLQQRADQALLWIKAQPKQKQIIYGATLMLLLAMSVVGLMPTKQKTNVAVDAPKGANELEKANAAMSPDISPEFNVLSSEKQKEIQELYAKAERAQAGKDWRTAFDSARTILTLVKRYKNTIEIMDQSQTYLNEDSIGNISRSLSSVKDAARENEEQLNLLLASGDKAIDEGRWEDAQEAFTKALNLDPNNERASKGFAQAHARRKDVVVTAPVQAPPRDLDAEAKQAERDEIDGLKREFQDARAKMNEGKFREGLPLLKNLDQKLYERLAQYKSGKRAPASIRDEMSNEVISLESRVKEGLETAKSQMKAEYQTQLSDAEQFESNRQYAQAREIYDRIIRTEPSFEDAYEARNKLYVKILAEAKTTYQEALIYEAVGDLENAVDGFQKSRDLLFNVSDSTASDYYKRATKKLKRLQR